LFEESLYARDLLPDSDQGSSEYIGSDVELISDSFVSDTTVEVNAPSVSLIA